MLMNNRTSALLVVDIQDRLLPAVRDGEGVVAKARTLLKAAAAMGVPILASEQYPQGIGHLVPAIAELIPPGATLEKLHFSCLSDADFSRRFSNLGRTQAVVVGLESHVCVLQTVEQLLERHCDVFVVADAVSSRTAASYEFALRRLEAAGARVVTAEMVVFEWLGQAGTPMFRELIKLIK